MQSIFLSPTIKIRDQILAPLLPLQLVKHAVAFSQIVRPNFSTFRGPKRQTSSQHWVNFHSWRCFLTCVWRPIGEDWSADVDRRLYKGNTHSLPERHSISTSSSSLWPANTRCHGLSIAAVVSSSAWWLLLLHCSRRRCTKILIRRTYFAQAIGNLFRP